MAKNYLFAGIVPTIQIQMAMNLDDNLCYIPVIYAQNIDFYILFIFRKLLINANPEK